MEPEPADALCHSASLSFAATFDPPSVSSMAEYEIRTSFGPIPVPPAPLPTPCSSSRVTPFRTT